MQVNPWTKFGQSLDREKCWRNFLHERDWRVDKILDMDKHWTSIGHGFKASGKIYDWTKFGQILDIDMSKFGLKAEKSFDKAEKLDNPWTNLIYNLDICPQIRKLLDKTRTITNFRQT